MPAFLATLITVAVASAWIFTTVVYWYLTFLVLVEWFEDIAHLVRGYNRIGFTVQEQLKNGEYKTVQGVFDKDKNKVIEARNIKSDRVDSQINAMHDYGKTPLVIWE